MWFFGAGVGGVEGGLLGLPGLSVFAHVPDVGVQQASFFTPCRHTLLAYMCCVVP